MEVPKATFAARQVKKPAPKQPIEVTDVDSSDLDSSSEIGLTGEETIDLTDN